MNALRVTAMAEAGGWSVYLPGHPVAADGATLDEAVTGMVDALREYAADWREGLSEAPNHRGNAELVRLVELSDDEQLRRHLLG